MSPKAKNHAESARCTPDTAFDNALPTYADAVSGLDGEFRCLPAVVVRQNHSQLKQQIVIDGRIGLDISRLSRQLAPIVSNFQHEPISVHNGEAMDVDNESIQVPKLNIVLQVVGSRGDVQPFIAIGQALKAYGHRVRLASHPTFEALVESNGLEFYSIGGDPSELMAYMVRNPGLLPSVAALRQGEITQKRKMMEEIFQACWQSCIEPAGRSCTLSHQEKRADGRTERKAFVADAIIANPPSFAHVHCAEKLGIPVHLVFTMPWTPTTAFQHPLANTKSRRSSLEPDHTNRMSYYIVDALAWQGLGSIINRFRHSTLGSDPINSLRAAGLIHSLRIPHTYCWSPTLLSKPHDWPSEIAVGGYAFLSQKESYTATSDILHFLAQGRVPIYVGFGSIVVNDPARLTAVVLEAVRLTGARAIISRGWAGLGKDVASNADVLFIDDCPHDWLFPRVSCAIHHGGAGTTAASLAAGCPTIIIPFFGDQPFWGMMVYRAGVGPHPIPYKSLTADALANAIRCALHLDVSKKVHNIATLIGHEDGAAATLRNFHNHLPLGTWTCALDESRHAVWLDPKHNMRLSSVAAGVLILERQLKPVSLTPFHVTHRDLSQGSWDPLSGAAYAVVDLFYETFRGMGEILTDVVLLPQSATKVITEMRKHKLEAQDATTSPLKIDGRSQSLPPIGKRSTVPGRLFMNGVRRVVKAATRAPGEFTLAMSQGTRNASRILGGRAVRPLPQVSGIGTGIVAGVSELSLGVYDGISGLVLEPVHDMNKYGPVGLATGLGKGIAKMPLKFWSGMTAVIAYPLKGIDKSVTKAFHNTDLIIKKARIEQSLEEAAQLPPAEKQAIIAEWYRLIQS